VLHLLLAWSMCVVLAWYTCFAVPLRFLLPTQVVGSVCAGMAVAWSSASGIYTCVSPTDAYVSTQSGWSSRLVTVSTVVRVEKSGLMRVAVITNDVVPFCACVFLGWEL